MITAKGLKLLETMRPRIEVEAGDILNKMSEQDCRELSRLCAMIFEDERKNEEP